MALAASKADTLPLKLCGAITIFMATGPQLYSGQRPAVSQILPARDTSKTRLSQGSP